MKLYLFLILVFSLFFVLQKTAFARSGCCSWHGEVSYCDTSASRYVCNDGTYSPTCGCTYIALKVIPRITPSPTPKPTSKPTPTPTLVATLAPSPEVKGEATIANPTPIPEPVSTPAVLLTAFTLGGIVFGLFYLVLKWIVKITSPKQEQ